MAIFVLQMLLFILQDEDKVNRSHRWPNTVKSICSGHCKDLELVSSLARVHNSESLYQTNVCSIFLFSCCSYYWGVQYKEGVWKARVSGELRNGASLHAGFYDLILFFSIIFLYFNLRPLCLSPEPLWTLNTAFLDHVTSHAHNYAKFVLCRLHRFTECDHNRFSFHNISFTVK